MKTITKLIAGAALAGGLALSATAPADAGVTVGVGIGVPGPGDHRHPCAYHRCGGPAVVVGAPAVGVYVGGRGYWDGHRYWGHRYMSHGVWRYR